MGSFPPYSWANFPCDWQQFRNACGWHTCPVCGSATNYAHSQNLCKKCHVERLSKMGYIQMAKDANGKEVYVITPKGREILANLK